MTAEFPFLSVLGLGFLLGAKHALDAVHIVAISTIATEQRGLGRACAIVEMATMWSASSACFAPSRKPNPSTDKKGNSAVIHPWCASRDGGPGGDVRFRPASL